MKLTSHTTKFQLGLLAVAFLSAACSNDETPVKDATDTAPVERQRLVVFAAMPRDRVQSVLDAYTVETGIALQLYTLDQESTAGPGLDSESIVDADLILLPNLADLWTLAEQDGFRPTFNASIDNAIPAELRDSESRWTGLATSARLLVYNSEIVAAEELRDLSDYAGFGAEQWRGKLCMSSSRVSGNLTLVAFLIRKYGLREAEIIVRRWRDNLAVNIFYSDAELLAAISGGKCAAGIAGSAALAAYQAANTGSPVMVHPLADAAEVVVEVSGGGISRHAHNPEAAAALLAWLTTAAPNALYAALGKEFPANIDAAVITAIEAWRESVENPGALTAFAFLHDEAVLLVERAKYP